MYLQMIKSFVLFVGMTALCAHAQTQQCNPNIKATTPDSRFTVNTDNTVTDKVTGLQWMRCSLGQTGTDCATGSATKHNWSDALAQNGYDFAGYSDWRLPNINELSSIAKLKCSQPAINITIFPNTQSYEYWSSSSSLYAYDGEFAWVVLFFNGSIAFDAKEYNYHVRLVRGGQ